MVKISKCPNCPALNNFEAVAIEVRNFPVQLTSIQCAACGAVVGIMDRYSISDLINKLAKKRNIHDLLS
jgi:heterodisulfide reductase subunit A-like polyferredoxin